MTTTETNPIDEARLEAFVGQAVTDMGAAISGLLLHIGDRLGLYKAMAGAGPVTSAALAARTGTAERYVRQWLEHHAASGLLEVDDPAAGPLARRYRLPSAHAPLLADPDDIRRGWPTWRAARAGRVSRWRRPTHWSRS